MRDCPYCDQLTAGDCGRHGVLVALPTQTPPAPVLTIGGLSERDLALQRIAAALESIAASLTPTIMVSRAGPPLVCTGSHQPAHGLALGSGAGVICPMCGAYVACTPTVLSGPVLALHPWREPEKEPTDG